jgi:hypothetical protein
MSHVKEKNSMMQAINSIKAALSAIEKEYTMQEGTGLGDQDGNHGQAVDGEQAYSADFENVKKKMLVKKMME